MDIITPTEGDSIPSQVERDIVYPSASNPGKKRGRPQGSKNRPKAEPPKADEQSLSQAHEDGNENQENLDDDPATNPCRKRGRPQGSKNRPKAEPLKADEQSLSQAHEDGNENQENLDDDPATNPCRKRGRPQGSKNRPKAEPLKADEQSLRQGHETGNEEREDLGGFSAANPGRKRGRPRGSKNRPRPEHSKADELFQGQRHHDREEERTYLAKVNNLVSSSEKRQQLVPEHEMQGKESGEVVKPSGEQGGHYPCSTDRGMSHARKSCSSPKDISGPDQSSPQARKYRRLDLPGPSNVPYKDSADMAASHQWRVDREAQARRFTQLEMFLATNDRTSNMGSDPERPRCQHVAEERVHLAKEKGDEMAMVERDTQGSPTNDDMGSDNSDGGSDDGELHGSASWVPLSVRGEPVGFLGQVRQDVGFLRKPSATQVGVPQPMMY